MNIEKILEEIYKADSSLKANEGEIKKIINSMILNKPDLLIDENFISGLKNKLKAKINESKNSNITLYQIFNYKLVGALVALILTFSASALLIPTNNPIDNSLTQLDSKNVVTIKSKDGIISKDSKTNEVLAGFVRFKSEEEYKDYIKNQDMNYYRGIGFGGDMRAVSSEMDSISAPTIAQNGSASSDSAKMVASNPSRVSETNVQVAGIDEPDFVKTDGKKIYISAQNYYYGGGIRPMPLMESEISEPSNPSLIGEKMVLPYRPEYLSKIQIVNAFPALSIAKEGTILNKSGNLLLSNNILVVLGDRNISAYDVVDSKNPKEKWSVDFDEKNMFVQARLFKNQIYLITNTNANRFDPCPIPLFKNADQSIIAPCNSIYHPTAEVSVNTTYHISTVDVGSGTISKKVSFVGSYDSTIYMSKDNLYVAYSRSGDMMKFFYGLMSENKDMFPATLISKAATLKTYDISENSKLNELQTAIYDYTSSLKGDEQLKFNNEMENRASDYFKKHKRELVQTDIVRIGLNTFNVEAMKSIPGKLLNQFALDEYNGYLRTAVTVGEFFAGGFGISGREEENDVYVLDLNLNITGSITGLGKDERIYSARFIEDKGYLVTFKQTDPFYVLDLKNPKKPEMVGELKIPGFSSYLHPITKDLILGVGMENSKVKISLFDVSNPTNPLEISKYSLNEYWTEVSNNHHAFLQDPRHKIFFIPGSNGGYVFSYENNKLTLKKAVSDITAKRALFIDDFLYVIGENKIVVLNENDWSTVKSLSL